MIVTNLSRPAERVTLFNDQRGKAEQYIEEGKNADKWTRLSCRKFHDNAVRLQLHALAAIPPASCGHRLCRRRWSIGR